MLRLVNSISVIWSYSLFYLRHLHFYLEFFYFCLKREGDFLCWTHSDFCKMLFSLVEEKGDRKWNWRYLILPYALTQTHTHTSLSAPCVANLMVILTLNIHSMKSHVSEMSVLLAVNTDVGLCVLGLCICTVNWFPWLINSILAP